MSNHCSIAGARPGAIVSVNEYTDWRSAMTTITPQSAPVSLYEAIGGRAALRAAVDVFYRRLLGGPERYRGPDLAGTHRGLGITSAQFDRTAGHLSDALDELAVPRQLADQV